MPEPPDEAFDYKGIDDIIHGRVRLAVMAYLSGAGSADFSELQKQTGVTDGNLSVHLRKLEQAGYLEVDKAFVDRKPRTLCKLSARGREAWLGYIDHMRTLLGPQR